MTNEEKLRALLAEAREAMVCAECGEYVDGDVRLRERIDAALAEPVGKRCGECGNTKSENEFRGEFCAVCEMTRLWNDLYRERDEARAALEKEKSAHRLEREAHDRRFDRETKCMKERDEARGNAAVFRAEASVFREALQDIVEHDCAYGDDCPDNAGKRHYRCLPCKAKKALKERGVKLRWGDKS